MSDPFTAVVEVCTEVVGDGGELVEKGQVWCANVVSSVNEEFRDGSSSIAMFPGPTQASSWSCPRTSATSVM